MTELIAIIFCTYILYFVNSINSLYLDTGPLWIPAFVLKGPPCLNKVFFPFIFHFYPNFIYVNRGGERQVRAARHQFFYSILDLNNLTMFYRL